MPDSFPINPIHFALLCLASAAVAFGGAALLRGVQGRPFFRPRFPDAEVGGDWVDGRSSMGLTAVVGRARNCLWFALTSDILHVGVHFPFNLFIGGFDLTIPVAMMLSVSKKSPTVGADYVQVARERGTVDRPRQVD